MPLGDDMMATLNHEISKSARNSEQLHMFARLLDWTIPILAFAGGIGTLTKSPQTILLGSAALAAAFLSAIRTAFNPRSKAVDAEAASASDVSCGAGLTGLLTNPVRGVGEDPSGRRPLA